MRFKMAYAAKIACVAGIWLIGASRTRAGLILIFEGLKNFEQVEDH